MKTQYCCGRKMKALEVTGRDKGGDFTYTRYECQRCGHFDFSGKLYVPGTAERGNKEAHQKDHFGRR